MRLIIADVTEFFQYFGVTSVSNLARRTTNAQILVFYVSVFGVLFLFD